MECVVEFVEYECGFVVVGFVECCVDGCECSWFIGYYGFCLCIDWYVGCVWIVLGLCIECIGDKV